jgi:hypothetical protein
MEKAALVIECQLDCVAIDHRGIIDCEGGMGGFDFESDLGKSGRKEKEGKHREIQGVRIMKGLKKSTALHRVLSVLHRNE